MFVISGPSGVGKGSVVAALLEREPSPELSVSCTTRAPREGERDGIEYRFLTSEAFDALVAGDGFLEWADVFGRRYGTPRAPVEEALDAGKDVLLEIDVQGARSVRERMRDAVLVFLVPPSRDELIRRLRERGTEDEAALQGRLERADVEMAERSWFDHVVVNDDLGRAAAEVAAIIEVPRV